MSTYLHTDAHAVSILPLRGLGRETPWLSFHPRPDIISGEPEAEKVLFVGRVAKLEDAVELSWSSIRPRQQIGI